jgi:Fe-S cluster biosynthesis and repair protein YggX
MAIEFRPFGPEAKIEMTMSSAIVTEADKLFVSFQRRSLMAENIKCTHCGEKRPALGFAPFPNELGQRLATEICQPCWAGWLQKQTQIINHYGLDLTNPDAQTFLFDNIKGFLFGEVPPVSEQAEIDTSKEGTVKW